MLSQKRKLVIRGSGRCQRSFAALSFTGSPPCKLMTFGHSRRGDVNVLFLIRMAVLIKALLFRYDLPGLFPDRTGQLADQFLVKLQFLFTDRKISRLAVTAAGC